MTAEERSKRSSTIVIAEQTIDYQVSLPVKDDPALSRNGQ
jgi:hypothetical protein